MGPKLFGASAAVGGACNITSQIWTQNSNIGYNCKRMRTPMISNCKEPNLSNSRFDGSGQAELHQRCKGLTYSVGVGLHRLDGLLDLLHRTQR